MQYINLNKTLDMEYSIVDLLLISIDDQININDDKDGIKISGEIIVGGKVKTVQGDKAFNENISLDVFLTDDEIQERSSLNVSVNDFNYTIEENKLLLNISLKLDGLKEIETTFLAKEDEKLIQEETLEESKNNEEAEIEAKEDKKVYIDIDVEVNERDNKKLEDDRIEDSTLVGYREENIKSELEEISQENDYTSDGEITEQKKKKSLLECVFSNRKINEEVSWKLHCVKGESSYEEIANNYKINLNKLISINNGEKLEEGKLIFLPLD